MIIQDEFILNKFIESLPEPTKDESYFICLMARGKYSTGDNKFKGEEVLYRNMFKNKTDLLTGIIRLDRTIDTYQSYEGKPYNIENLVLYIKPNVRCNTKTMLSLNYKINLRLSDIILQHDVKQPSIKTLHLNACQESVGTRSTYTIDFDFNDNISDSEKLLFVNNKTDVFREYKCLHRIIQTNSGYHVHLFVDKMKDLPKTWYKDMMEISGYKDKVVIETPRDAFSPIVGTVHGGKVPELIYLK